MKKFLLNILIILFILSFLDCSKTIYIKAEGNIFKHVTFSFFDSIDKKIPGKYEISNLVVQEQVESSNWRIVWRISGSAKLDMLIYGSKYQGLFEKKEAENLKSGGRYRVVATFLTQMAPGNGYAIFTITGNGDLIQEQ